MKIKSTQVVIFYPDIEDNLSKAKKDQFGVKINKVSKFKLKNELFKQVLRDGKYVTEFDNYALFRLSVDGFVNPIDLEFEDETRPIRVNDLIDVPELAELAEQVQKEVNRVSQENVKDSKKVKN